MTQNKQTENMTLDKTNREYDTRQNKQNMTQDKTNKEYDTRQNKQRI